MNSNTQTDERASDQARAQLDSIIDMMDRLEAVDEDNDEDREAIETEINEDPLSLQVRSGWHSPGAESESEEFEILLCTGGPAVRIIGELNQYEPETAILQFQDWFTPWKEYEITDEEEEKLLNYCQHFYYGD